MATQTEPKILFGNVVSDAVLETIKTEIESAKFPRKPGLATILVGNDPASKAYVGMKQKACEKVGIETFNYLPDPADGPDALKAIIEECNANDAIDGILLQLPLPNGFDDQEMLELIAPEKDVDGFHPVNVGKLLLGLPTFKSCTPFGVCKILEYYNIDPAGKHVVIIGRSNIVGKPLAAMLVQKADGANATVTICHSRSKNLNEITRSADILVAAIGRPHFVTSDMVKPGAVVIDVGINKVDDATTDRGYKLVGDVDFDAVMEVASAVTPVPKGVGPMTIAMLLSNTLQSFKAR